MTWNLVTVAFGDIQYRDGQNFLNQKAKELGVNSIRISEKEILDSDLYKDYKENEWMSSKDKYGWCAYKPYFLLKLMNELPEGDRIALFDTVDIFHPQLFQYIDTVLGDNDPCLLVCGNSINKSQTKRDCFVYMDCDEEDYWNSRQLEAGVTFWRVCDKAKSILAEWLEWCLDERVNGDETSFSNEVEFPEFHGFCGKDQSILTNLAVREGLPVDGGVILNYIECNADYWYERHFDHGYKLNRQIDDYLIDIQNEVPYINKSDKRHSIILTVHNKEWLIGRVLDSIMENTIGDYELIVVVDGCTDDSMKVIIDKIEDFKNWTLCSASDVFETKANNIGLKEATGDYVIIIQDDMVIEEFGWNRRLQKPFNEFDDVFAVTANASHNWIFNQNSVHVNMEEDLSTCWCDIFESTDVANHSNIDRNTFAIRGTVNRGPLMIDLKDLKELDYLDEEYAPQDMDDHDLMFRMRKKLGKVCGCYWIGYRSDSSWGGTRVSGQPAPWLFKTQHKNSKIFYKRNKEFLDDYRIVENRKVAE